ncbi:MAG TPA: hypothetical protein ENF41_01350 [Candidatus Bathyarchaeota archaeon]|nr:hypothetical protein [Candidatus Bathyarchaeota archaeon]
MAGALLGILYGLIWSSKIGDIIYAFIVALSIYILLAYLIKYWYQVKETREKGYFLIGADGFFLAWLVLWGLTYTFISSPSL